MGRSQRVSLLGSLSKQANVGCGVPQGSVLGPLLFLVYINDLADIEITGTFTLFADDATVFWHNRDVLQLNRDINDDLSKIKQWCDSNKLTCNVSKTGVMSFRGVLNDVFLEDNVVSNLQEHTFLGIYI